MLRVSTGARYARRITSGETLPGISGFLESMSRSVATVVLASALVLLAMGGTASAGYDHLLAPTTECGRSQQTSPKLSADKQEAVMRCMHNYARKKVGKGRSPLSRS